jgi:DNA (cytosine-5)-methyltransferase 1
MGDGLRIGSLFTGTGALDLAVADALPAAATAWCSDTDRAASAVIAARMGGAENLGDIRRADWSAVPPVDIITGGFPCTDVSHAGRGAGLADGTRSGLWQHMAEAVGRLRPRLVVIENVRGLRSAKAGTGVGPGGEGVAGAKALGVVLGDLADLGFDAEWESVHACHVGAPHRRERVYIAAWPADDPSAVRMILPPQGGPLPEPPALLPTPNPFHSTNRETPSGWRERRAEVKARTGTMHGPALPVVAASIMEGDPIVAGDFGPRPDGWSPPYRRGDFGPYAEAVGRWGSVLGRPAPPLVDPADGKLSPQFVEWMMGLPDGWVTGVPGVGRGRALAALGNAVVPQAASSALRAMAARS